MEDTISLVECFGDRKDWLFGGVFDGHAGDKVAKKAEKNLANAFLYNLNTSLSVPGAFRQSYKTISEAENFLFSGCTALCFFVNKQDMFIANAGDSRLIIVVDGDIDQITEEHTVNNLKEQKRIESKEGKIEDGYVWKGLDGRVPTRALGDHYFESVGVISEPEIFFRTLPKNKEVFIIAATDGLWDEVDNRAAAKMVKGKKSPKEAGEEIMNSFTAFSTGTLDNISLIVVKI
ncbi:protein serine/threonine phosphatase 2C family protein [Candidatus Falkowbacteria bacterium]|nr:protein serine/threonine phosphatase 2C family protein [Candidatus Falkowbacteria bacterium]MBT4432987.1 protein serine/threonine phosphatase 2C family protein [Candidatus Falkowbacteria bacterium]